LFINATIPIGGETVKRTLKAALLSALIASAGTAAANEISRFETRLNTDWTYAGVGGLRGTGAGSIVLSGLSGTVTRAYLYWHGPTNATDPAFNAGMTFAGSAITGSSLGFSDDNSWAQANSQAYRADVTSLVSNNGSYAVSGLSPNNSNGAQLIVFFNDGNSANNRDVVLFDGNDGNFPNAFDLEGWNASLVGINYTSGGARMVLGVSDGQDFEPLDDGSFRVNGVLINPGGDFFDGTTVPNTAGTTVANGALWDIVTTDVTSLLSPGHNTLTLELDAFDDALSLISVAIDLPAAIPEPGEWALMLAGLGIVSLAARARRKGRTSA
jgi:hypothetical protein